jgi:hypothetical protein
MKQIKKNVLVLLMQKKFISSLDALNLAGTMRLSAYVHVLRQEGYNIISKWNNEDTKDYKLYKIVKSK